MFLPIHTALPLADIAAPIFDDRHYPIASVCVTIAGSLVTGAQIDQIGAEVRRVALHVSADQASVKQEI
jgi:DNA-binding IclR family transcriptional regulator